MYQTSWFEQLTICAVLPSPCNHWYLSHQFFIPICRIGDCYQCYACADVELIIRVTGPAYSSPALFLPRFPVLHFSPLHFWSWPLLMLVVCIVCRFGVLVKSSIRDSVELCRQLKGRSTVRSWNLSFSQTGLFNIKGLSCDSRLIKCRQVGDACHMKW